MPARGAQQFSEFLHGASAAITDEACASLVPAVKVPPANPVRVAAIDADVDDTLFGTLVVAAVVIFHDFHVPITKTHLSRGA